MLNSVHHKFSCGIIGGSNLTIICADILLKNGHKVEWVLPRGNLLYSWAKLNNIPVYISQYEVISANISVDYIFSIVNDLILSPKMLEIATQFSVNYHNSMLPRYGGVFATSWAILNNERKHGITWHVLDEGIDTGDILVQRTVIIDNEDTGWSLNQKCYVAAIEAFCTKLLPELESCITFRKPQVFSDKTYYSLYKKPKYAGLLLFDSLTEELYRMHRALSRGDIDNSFEQCKILVHNCFYIVKDVSCMQTESQYYPGTILSIDDKGVVVATTDGAIKIRQLTTYMGEIVSVSEWCGYHNLSVGQVLSSPSADYGLALQEVCELVARDEMFCIKQWKKVSPGTDYNFNTKFLESVLHKLPSNVDQSLLPSIIMLAMSTIASIFGLRSTTILFSSFILDDRIKGFEPFFNTFIPIFIQDNDSNTVDQQILLVDQTCKEAELRGIHAKDLFMRRKFTKEPVDLSFKICDKYENNYQTLSVLSVLFYPYSNEVVIISQREWLRDKINVEIEDLAIQINSVVSEIAGKRLSNWSYFKAR